MAEPCPNCETMERREQLQKYLARHGGVLTCAVCGRAVTPAPVQPTQPPEWWTQHMEP